MASDGSSPHSPSLRLGLTALQPSRRHHAQSLLGPSFHDTKTPHVLESHPEQAAPLSRCVDEQQHAVGSHSALARRLYLAACNPSSRWRSWVLNQLYSNLSQPRAIEILSYSCLITGIQCLNLYVCVYLFIFCLCCDDRNGLELWVLVYNC